MKKQKRQKVSFNKTVQQKRAHAYRMTTSNQSHLVKHTANIITSSLRSSGVFVVMVHLRCAHGHALLRGRGKTSRVGDARSGWATGRRHVVGLNRLAVVHLGHPTHSSTPQSRVLVAVPPAVDSSLDESTLTAQAWVQLR